MENQNPFLRGKPLAVQQKQVSLPLVSGQPLFAKLMVTDNDLNYR
jgi:hypothetical protein